MKALTKIEREIEEYKRINEEIKALQAKQAALKEELLRLYFSNHEEFKDKRGVVLATYKVYTKQVFDTKRFKVENEMLYNNYCYEQEAKTFLVK